MDTKPTYYNMPPVTSRHVTQDDGEEARPLAPDYYDSGLKRRKKRKKTEKNLYYRPLQYTIEQIPPWYICFFLALQVTPTSDKWKRGHWPLTHYAKKNLRNMTEFSVNQIFLVPIHKIYLAIRMSEWWIILPAGASNWENRLTLFLDVTFWCKLMI